MTSHNDYVNSFRSIGPSSNPARGIAFIRWEHSAPAPCEKNDAHPPLAGLALHLTLANPKIESIRIVLTSARYKKATRATTTLP